MKRKTKFGLILLGLLIVIQFFPIKKNKSDKILDTDFIKIYNPPQNVATMLKTSCYDCHSNNTIYPWYSKIQPVAWYLQHHVNEGKHEVNFSEFGKYSLKRKKHKLDECIDEVKENEMPLTSYTLIHGDAKLSANQKEELISWLENTMNNIKE